MDNVKVIPCENYEEVCKQIENKIKFYMMNEDFYRTKTDVWAFWRTMRCFIVCENEVAILEDMYDLYMGTFNKANLSKKEFVVYMMEKYH